MAVKETNTGRRRTGKQTERTFYITGAASETEARLELLADTGVPAEIDGHFRSDADCTAEELDAGRYLGTAVYRSSDATNFQPVNSFSISFDISGQSTRITQSINTRNRYASGAEAPDFHGAINVQQDGSIDGCEIFTPMLTHSVTFTFGNDDVTTEWINLLASIVGTVNDAEFWGYAGGELLLSKVSGQKRNDGSNLWDINFGFLVSLNCVDGQDPYGDPFIIRVPAELGESIVIQEKLGWDYLWVRYEERNFTDAGTGKPRTAKVPIAAYVEQVYYFTDYSLLGIGT